MKILVVEDEPALVYMLRYNLEKDGHKVFDAETGDAALRIADVESVDIVLLDWMLSGTMDGVEVCRAMRKSPRLHRVPVIMLTARSQEGDKVKALDAGADDYITKPFSVLEMLARIKAISRRVKPASEGTIIECAGLKIDAVGCRAFCGDVPVHLGPTEFRLLLLFMENPRKVFSRDELLTQIWGGAVHVEERTIDVHIRRLRQSLGRPDLIRTVRGAGYSLNAVES